MAHGSNRNKLIKNILFLCLNMAILDDMRSFQAYFFKGQNWIFSTEENEKGGNNLKVYCDYDGEREVWA